VNPVDISKQIKKDFQDYLQDSEDRNNSFFGLALAQWETKSLKKETSKAVEEIIENATEIQLWLAQGADEKTIEKREKEIQKFRTEISIDRSKPTT